MAQRPSPPRSPSPIPRKFNIPENAIHSKRKRIKDDTLRNNPNYLYEYKTKNNETGSLGFFTEKHNMDKWTKAIINHYPESTIEGNRDHVKYIILKKTHGTVRKYKNGKFIIQIDCDPQMVTEDFLNMNPVTKGVKEEEVKDEEPQPRKFDIPENADEDERKRIEDETLRQNPDCLYERASENNENTLVFLTHKKNITKWTAAIMNYYPISITDFPDVKKIILKKKHGTVSRYTNGKFVILENCDLKWFIENFRKMNPVVKEEEAGRGRRGQRRREE
ncbi:hypothetical protein NL108_014100 [Boleophthalmus pectinirostris]|nr:hypothetical protein NL108_014100 [Boleophthalmus pectinirostris]